MTITTITTTCDICLKKLHEERPQSYAIFVQLIPPETSPMAALGTVHLCGIECLKAYVGKVENQIP